LTNGPAGAIGASLPYAIGAKIARPEARIVAVMGDGTVGFHLAELETAAREQLGITVLVGNDSRWNAEHLIQKQNYGLDRTFACELTADTRYDLAATGLASDGCFVEDLSQLPGALSQGINTSRPICINVKMPGAPAPRYTRFDI
jgi:acetolactate synthase-1/2/3 large subunit